ncbi:MAG: ArgR family transcriptional regulator [Pseudomonadota bacterium]|nr:ArgR family transcriptional regulator [Pseudomonadota bacterium]
MTSKFALIDDLRRLLIEGKVATQEEVCAALESLGHPVNQSKVSRLLRKIGAVKSKNEHGQIVYRLQLEPAPPTTTSQLSSLIIDVDANETIIVVYTSPGSAQLIARILDYHKKEIQILATIAGDDAIFVAPTSIKSISQSVSAIRKLLFE